MQPLLPAPTGVSPCFLSLPVVLICLLGLQRLTPPSLHTAFPLVPLSQVTCYRRPPLCSPGSCRQVKDRGRGQLSSMASLLHGGLSLLTPRPSSCPAGSSLPELPQLSFQLPGSQRSFRFIPPSENLWIKSLPSRRPSLSCLPSGPWPPPKLHLVDSPRACRLTSLSSTLLPIDRETPLYFCSDLRSPAPLADKATLCSGTVRPQLTFPGFAPTHRSCQAGRFALLPPPRACTDTCGPASFLTTVQARAQPTFPRTSHTPVSLPSPG